MRHPAKRCTYDDTLLVTVLVLVIAGLVLLTSISAYNGNVKFHDSFYYLKKQGLRQILTCTWSIKSPNRSRIS